MDSKTLILAIVPVILAGVFIHVVNAAIHRDSDGPRWWLAGTAAHGLGLGLISLRGVVPDLFGIVVGDILAAGGFMIMLEGLARFAGQTVPRWQHAMLAALILIGFPALTWIVDNAAIRFAVFGVAVIVPNLLMLRYLQAVGARDGQFGVRLLRYNIYFFVLALVIVCGDVLLLDPDMPGILAPNQTVAVGILSMMVVETNLVFGFVLLSAGRSASVLRQAALTDYLTGLPNRRAFEAQVAARLAEEPNDQPEAALAVFDVDHFKQVNDTYGHDVGDAVLQHVANVLAAALRQTDHVARLGGEEFVALIHAGSGASAAEIAERVRGAVEAQPFRSDGLEISVTISAGLVELAEAQPSLTRLLKLADEALYRAKGAGRNRIILAAA